ncbi:hypothetical protein [Plebeiibacterium marinum]|uniref:Uncharacterized protein n=1 Tax=Plebeiibacterium marinum TaxID=2992111 RepID=A0AAE3SIE7_9BACT|nr:hypothetical protein [Plebeiobacterium marinum]MCW3804368.1 hypothetical protein [Plebeiobacterium marinum]
MQKEVQFKYEIPSPGMARGELTVHNTKVPFEVANVSNPLFDLLKGMTSLVLEPSHLWDEENICWVDWYSDLNGYKWTLSTNDGKNLQIKLVFLEDIFNEDEAQTIINTHCNFHSFYQEIIQELDRFIKNIGLLNYQQLWQKDEFPLTYFLILKKHLLEQDKWEPIIPDNTTFLDELNLLQL